jgi:hypothetical protein
MDDSQNHWINSMTWYDLIPVFGVVVTIAGISFKAGQILQKQDNNTEDIKEIKTELKDLVKRVTVLETKNTDSNQKTL